MPSSRYALLTYQACPEYNVGDYIQSLAAKRFLPRVDKYINREKLSHYREEKVRLIMNGWFMHHSKNWPPSENIDPLLVSFHLNSQARDQLLNEEGKKWFVKHGPVGCRDEYTLRVMEEAGVGAYLSGCLTTTFANKYHYRTNDIYFADVMFRTPSKDNITRTPKDFLRSVFNGGIFNTSKRKRLLTGIFDEQLLQNAISLEHYHTCRHPERERFEMAENFLEKYATAKLVVTSRLHCALPCLAFGTPVIFVQCGFNREYDKCRLDGVTDLFNTIYIDEKERVTANFTLPAGKITEDFSIPNPESFRKKVDPLRKACYSFIHKEQVPA